MLSQARYLILNFNPEGATEGQSQNGDRKIEGLIDLQLVDEVAEGGVANDRKSHRKENQGEGSSMTEAITKLTSNSSHNES